MDDPVTLLHNSESVGSGDPDANATVSLMNGSKKTH